VAYVEKLATTIDEPVTVDQATQFARLTDADAPIVELLLPACREAIEALSGVKLASQEFRVSYDREELASQTWPRSVQGLGWDPDLSELTFRPGPLGLVLTPVTSISSLKSYDADDVETTIDAADYALDATARPSRVRLGSGLFSMASLRETRCLVAHVVAGYTSATIPHAAKLAILRTLATNAEHREDVVAGTVAVRVPDVVEQLLSGLRAWSL
jgi:hypothetical protein